MKINYRNFGIEVNRDKCLAGCSLLYFSVYSLNDKYKWIDSFEDLEETIRNKIKELKTWVDNWHKDVKKQICPTCEEKLTITKTGNLYCGDCNVFIIKK